jgi:hypothetical protein
MLKNSNLNEHNVHLIVIAENLSQKIIIFGVLNGLCGPTKPRQPIRPILAKP